MNKDSKETVETVETNSTEAPVTTPDKETNSKKKMVGVVTNCLSLAVRTEPAIESACLTALSVLTKVDIDKSKSTDEFYKINTEAGVEGYCKKDYITIK